MRGLEPPQLLHLLQGLLLRVLEMEVARRTLLSSTSSSLCTIRNLLLTLGRLVVVGDPGKLKQYLLATYVTNKYPEEYVLPVYDNYAVTVMYVLSPAS